MTQSYASSKIVTAWEADKDGEPGYAVKYPDGYTSWCPKKQFEESNVALGHTGMLQPYQERLVAEHAQLRKRLDALTQFLDAQEEHLTIHEDEFDLLEEQHIFMDCYCDVLEARLQPLVDQGLWQKP